ncbi:uncharacterized protein LOC143460338 [Clavelina lepadiformis]|uniref:uncharacterized protein LOC143460338 n=1 Tax=Clavelina lepadiformis TaxID=159417 RepID=UPI004041E490
MQFTFKTICKFFNYVMETSTIQQNLTVTVSMMTQKPHDDTLFVNRYIGALAVTFLLVAMGIYLVLCLFFYEYRVGMKNRQIGQLNRQRKHLIYDRVADWMRWLCLIASILALVRLCLEIVEIKLGQSSSTICDPIRKFKAVLLCAVITCLYLVLWLRQRMLYRTPAMLHLSNKIVQFFSRSVIIIMTIASVLTISLYVGSRGYQSSGSGCRLKWSSIWTKLPGLLQFIFTTLFQVILLGLFIDPLHKHRVAMKTVISKTSNKETDPIKRVTIATSVAVVSDAVTDMLVNILAIICSFADWRTRMAPFLVRQDKVVGTVKRKLIDNQRTRATNVPNYV